MTFYIIFTALCFFLSLTRTKAIGKELIDADNEIYNYIKQNGNKLNSIEAYLLYLLIAMLPIVNIIFVFALIVCKEDIKEKIIENNKKPEE